MLSINDTTHIDWLSNAQKKAFSYSMCRIRVKKCVGKLIEFKKQPQCWTMSDNVGQRWTLGFCDVVSLQPYPRMNFQTRKDLGNKLNFVQLKITQLCLQTLLSTLQTGYNRRTMVIQLTPDRLSFTSR